MRSRRRVALLFGGASVEHEVSVISARAVAVALGEAELDCVPIGVTGDGRWLGPERSREILEGGEARAETAVASDAMSVAVDPGGGRFLRLVGAGEARALEVDVVFPLVHGWGGEDGRLQGLLDLVGLPFVGPGVTGSAVAMDKVVSKQLFAAAGLPLARWFAVGREEYSAAREAIHARVADELRFPAFVKPSNGGSSVGVSRVTDRDALAAAFTEAFDYDHRVIAERGIDAREIECAVIGNSEPQASGVGEIVPSREFYDYAAKYLDGTSVLEIPARLDARTSGSVRQHSLAAFRSLDLAGLARVDFLVDRHSLEVYLNEVNTLPGFTPISMFPKLWQAEGLAFPALVRRLVELAVERRDRDRGLRTRCRLS